MHIFENLVRQANDAPNATFCHFYAGSKYKHHTVAEVVDASRCFAGRLAAEGIGAGDVVPIILEHRVELYVCFIGAVMRGAVPTLLAPLTQKQDPQVFGHSMGALMARLQPHLVVGSSSTLPLIALLDATKINVDDVAQTVHRLADPDLAPDATAFMQHSSGTTGLKKGVRLSGGQILQQIAVYAEAIQLDAMADVVASWLPLYHDMGLITSFLLPAISGIPIVSLDATEWVIQPTLLLDVIARHRATLCWLPNFAFHHIARLARPESEWDLSTVRMIVNCSEPCRAAAFEVFLDRFGACGITAEALQVSFAMAENVFAATQTCPGQMVRVSDKAGFAGYLSCGRPVRDTEIIISDPGGSVLADGEVGEISIRSGCLFDGYDKQPELSAIRLRDGRYHTGDIGFIDAGELFVVGRLDDVLNINGKKLIAHEVEAALNAVPGVAPGRILVYERHDETNGATALLVAVELDAGQPSGEANISTEIRKRVLATCGLRPTAVTVVPRGFLIKSTAGKISRQASIRKLLADQIP